MKKILGLSFLSISLIFGADGGASSSITGDATTIVAAAVSTSSGTDYATHFEIARQKKVKFENKGEQAVAFDVTATITRVISAKEAQIFVTDEEFFYLFSGKKYRRGKFINPNDKKMTFSLTGPDGNRISQKRHITLASGQTIELTLGFMSYFIGLENLTGMENHVTWDVNEHGLNVLLGVSVLPLVSSVSHTSNSTFFYMHKYIDEIMMLSSLYEERPDFLELLISTPPSLSGPKIPKINHRMWLNPLYDPPEIALKKYVDNTLLLGSNWKHVFWCIDKSKIENAITYLQQNIPGVAVRELKEITLHSLWPQNIFDGLMSDSYYTVASNIARLFVLMQCGGVYCDLGAEIFPNLEVQMKQYQHIFGRRNNSNQIVEGFLAAHQGSSFFGNIFSIWSKLTRSNYEYMKSVEKRNDSGVALISSEIFFPQLYELRNKGLSYALTSEGDSYKFNSLHSWFQDGKYGNTSSLRSPITLNSLLGYFGIPSTQLEKDIYGTLISDYSLAHDGLVQCINEHFHGMSKESVVEKRRYHYQKALNLYLNKLEKAKKIIPHIHHRIWLTDPKNPFEVSEKLLIQVKNSLSVLIGNWQTIFWFNVPELLPQTLRWINTNIPNAQIRHTQEISTSMRGKEIFDALYSMNRFANSGILLRYNILSKFGGIYADMGTLLRYDIQEAIDKFDYVFCQRDCETSNNWLDVNLMASKPNGSLWIHFFDFIENLKKHPSANPLHKDFFKLKRYMPVDVDHAWIAGHALSAAIDKYLTDDEAMLPMNFNSLFKYGGAKSWYKSTKFGSNSCLTHPYKFV